MNVKVVELKEYSNDNVGLLVQIILTELLGIFAIISLINSAFMPVFYSIITLTMFSMAYNNAKFYKKKYMTSIYIIIGLFVLVTTLTEYLF